MRHREDFRKFQALAHRGQRFIGKANEVIQRLGDTPITTPEMEHLVTEVARLLYAARETAQRLIRLAKEEAQ